MSKRNRSGSLSLVTIVVQGQPIQATAQSIRPAAIPCHGDYKGTKVNSPAIALVGDSVVLWADASKPNEATGMTKPYFATLAKKFDELEGNTRA